MYRQHLHSGLSCDYIRFAMKRTNNPMPDHEAIKRLLFTSRSFSDPRAAAAVTLVLAHGFTIPKLHAIRDEDFYAEVSRLRFTWGSYSRLIPLSRWTSDQLLRIRRSGQPRNLFTKSPCYPAAMRTVLRDL